MISKKDSIQNKITDREALARICAGWRVKGYKIVFTNGVFDLLHKGHISILLEAAEAGDRLVVGLNTDNSVQRLKGPGRPLQNESDRAFIMAAQTYADAVTLFDEDTPLELIRAIKPDVIVKGGDYAPEEVVGKDIVESYGGKVMIVPLEEGRSTTGIIEKAGRH